MQYVTHQGAGAHFRRFLLIFILLGVQIGRMLAALGPPPMPTILHVGTDICRRIPVMRASGFAVFQSEDSVNAVRRAAFVGRDIFSVITFDSDTAAPSEGIITAVRNLTAAPLVLFENALIYCEKSGFDLVVPAFTHPSRWVKKLRDAIEGNREQCERARQIRQECAAVLSHFQAMHVESARVRVNPVDVEAPWCAEKVDPWIRQ